MELSGIKRFSEFGRISDWWLARKFSISVHSQVVKATF
jgi:hypothetical protein